MKKRVGPRGQKRNNNAVWIILVIALIVLAAFVIKVTFLGKVVYGESRPVSCMDSDMNNLYPDGLNFEQNGNVRSEGSKYSDYCEDNLLVEYYCYNGMVREIEYLCEFGCFQGRGRCMTNLEGSLD